MINDFDIEEDEIAIENRFGFIFLTESVWIFMNLFYKIIFWDHHIEFPFQGGLFIEDRKKSERLQNRYYI